MQQPDTLSQTTSSSWLAIGLVYVAALLQGLAMVSFPASGTILKTALGFTDAQYGAIFLPQVALAVAGSIGGGTLAEKIGLKRLLVLALAANALSQLLLASSVAVGPELAFGAVMVGTAAMGLGFGLSGAPLNSMPPQFFPEHRDTAVVAVHTALGLGLAVGPLIVAPFISAERWVGFPLLLLALCVVAALGVGLTALPGAEDEEDEDAGAGRPVGRGLFWLFVAIAVLYAFAEGTFSNWAVLYLHDGVGVPEATAGVALSVFWGALVGGRLLVSALVAHVEAKVIWLVLPGLMVAAFLLLPLAEGAASGIALFGLAGLGCSAFFPLTITLISRAFPEHVAWASSMMIAALMVGVGAGSFVFGPLRDLFSFARLYQFSAVYPVLALLLAALASRSGPCRQTIREMWTGSRCN